MCLSRIRQMTYIAKLIHFYVGLLEKKTLAETLKIAQASYTDIMLRKL